MYKFPFFLKQVTSRRCFVSNNNIYIDEIGKKVFGLETSHDEEMNECRLFVDNYLELSQNKWKNTKVRVSLT